MIRAISFDLDGTLYRVRRLRVFVRLKGHRRVLLASVRAREQMRLEPALEDQAALRQREIDLVAQRLGWQVGRARAAVEGLHAELPVAMTRGSRPFEGVLPVIRAAMERGLKLAVFSDYAPDEKLQQLGLTDLPWGARVGAEQHGALKPHERGFLAVASELGLAPDEILHIGDREDIDVRGALNAGFSAARFAPQGASKSAATLVFQSWSAQILEGLDVA